MLAKSKLNNIEVSISKASIDSVISHDEFVVTNNVLKEYNEMIEEIKNLKLNYTKVYRRFSSIKKTKLSCFLEKIHKVKI